jgi:transcriptional regulator with XRE-family HTH domain
METGVEKSGEAEALVFGRLLRERRKALGLRQEDVVLATGVGRRYLIELEAGKPTARLGPALMIARQLGIRFVLAGSGPGGSTFSGGDDLGLPPLMYPIKE